MPKVAKDVFKWSTFSAGVSRNLSSGSLVVIKGGEKEILSIATNVAIDEKRISLVEFDRNGEVISYQSYSKSNFEAALKTAVEYDFMKHHRALFDVPADFKPSNSPIESMY